ncbi:hypothetical protein FOCC_FOCC002693 [Frankliniella occidentalis]|uniref:Proteoglycan 4 n=1 Tax=Frankliniella occidentalis TaxID=133901 RepID=A0A6J1SMR4_FRAOC|nr:proteoglycan 4 [Frankliniella occidentalis]KAE8750716.1 hypothetical protein FOCC_FOCC002693 [Frankliniella occidentalis]
MCDQTEVQYLPGEVVWVKLRALWWPGLVQDYDVLPEEITCSLRKRPIATVKFFQEDSYEYVHKLDLIYHYNCSRKHEFIKKGLDLCRKKTADRPATMDFFPMDIVTAEELTHGDPNILQDEAFKPEEKPKYTSLFGSEKKKFGKKKGKEDSPLKDKVARRKKLTSKLQAMGWLSRGITANIIYPSPDIPRMVTHRRFLNKVRNPDAKSDYEVRIREQKCEDDLQLEKSYECVLCGYATGRLNVIVLHFNNTHSLKTKNIFPTPSILKGGSFRNPLLKLKTEHRKSDSGKSSILPKKRASFKSKVEKVKVVESEGDSSESEIVKPAPVKKEKGKPGRKRKIKPEEKDNTEVVKEVVKKPKVLDSLLADWEEDAEQEDDDSEKRQDDEDDNASDVNASIDDDMASAKDESSLAEDASSASKLKEVFEFDPDEDDNIDFDLTPNVKGFGRRIPRVIDSSKDKKRGAVDKKVNKGKGTKKIEEDEDEFETLLAETSMPSLPSVPKASTFSLDTDEELNPTLDKCQGETSSKSILKEQNETEVTKEEEGKEQKSKNSDPEVDLAVDSGNPPQAHEEKITAKVTVETVPELAITSPEHNEDRLLSGDESLKNESKPGQSTGGGDHTYVSGGSTRKRRRSLLPLDKGESRLDIMTMPVVMDDEFPVEESPRVHKQPVLPRDAGQPTPRRVGRPPKRGGGARRGGKGMKSPPPLKSPKSPPAPQSSKSPSHHLSSKSPPPIRGSKSPSPQAMSPPRYPGPKSPPGAQGAKSPQPHRSPKSPAAEQTPKSPERTPKSPSNRQSSKSPSIQQSPKALASIVSKSPVRSPDTQGPKSPLHQSPKSPRSPQPYQSPSHQGPKSPQGFLSPKSPPLSPPALLSPKSPKASEMKTIKSPPQSPLRTTTDLPSPPALTSIKSTVKSPQVSPSSQSIVVSTNSPIKSPAGKVLTAVGKGSAVLKKVVTSNAVIVQSKPDLQPEACGLGKIIASSPSSTTSSSSGTVKTIKVAVSGTPGSSPMVVGKVGTPGTPGTRKVMIVKGKGGTQQMLLPTEASQQLLNNIGSGKKIMVITKGASGQQKIMLTTQQQKLLTSGTSSGQIVTSKGTVLSSVAKLVSTKPSTSRASGMELSTEPPALVKTDSKKTYKIITSPQSKGNILLNTSGGQILLPVSSIAASGSGVTTTSGSKQFILPVGAKNMKLLNAVSGTGQKVILQMKSSPAKVGTAGSTKTIQPIVPKTMQSISPKTIQAISPKGVQSITSKTVQPITPKTVQPITPKGSQPVKVTKIATMIQPVPQLTPIGAPKTPRPQKQIKTVVAKQVKGTASPKSPRKSTVLPKASIASSSSSTVVLPSTTPLKRNSGIVPNPTLKPIVPQMKMSKKVSLAAKPPAVDSMPGSSMPGTVQVVSGSVPGLEQIQTTLVPSVETSSGVPLPTSTQQIVAVPTEDGGQVMYLIDNNQLGSLINLDGANPGNLQNIILTFDNMGQPVSSAASDFTFSTPSSGQDILAEALANTQVLQSETSGAELGLDTSGLLSSHASSSVYQPTLSHGVLETSLTLNQPIMTPLEDLSAVSTLQPPPTSGAAACVDLPSTITVPDITISTSSYSSLPIPSATIQSTVFSDVQHVTTFSTAAPTDGNVFIETPCTEGEPFLSTDGVFEQSSEGASMPLLDG